MLSELKSLTKNIKKFQVFPSVSDANYFLKKPGCAPTVWDIKVNGNEKIDKYVNDIKYDLRNCNFIVYLRNQLDPKYTYYTQYILKNWMKVKAGKFFDIYSRQ